MNDILQHKGYYAEIHFSAEDEVFFGKIIGINDLVNFEADSVKALKKEFANAVADYIATCQALGKDPNKTYKGSFNVRIPSSLHKEAATFAALKKVTLNEYVRYALDNTIANEKLGY